MTSDPAPRPVSETPHIGWWLSDLPNPGPYYDGTMRNVVAKALGIDTEEERLVILRESDFAALSSAPQGRGDAVAWRFRLRDPDDSRWTYTENSTMLPPDDGAWTIQPLYASLPSGRGDYETNRNKFRVAEKSGVTQVVGRGDVSAECSGSAINDTGISLFSDKGEVRLTFAEWHELAAMIQPVADHPGLARISFDHLRPAPSSEPETPQ